ncbi:hypothetical protein FQR65_LT06472 [Abscondita terminalis]|nr:hypothetical protein FQR65_LT06472 [Abscondita terminalis]
MGAITSRQHAGVEEVDISSNHAYKYPPRSGNYFGSHFIMGGERFDTPQPESYLFGENTDLNFLGSRPTPFPYPPPQPNEPTKTLKSLVNIRKESLRFVRAPPIDFGKARSDGDHRDVELGKGSPFNIEFIFDCDVRCAITIYYFCTEEITSSGVTYIPKDPTLNSETFRYKRGANQQFCQIGHVFEPSRYSEDELLYDIDREVIPVAIHCVAEEGPEDMRQSHTTVATIEKSADGSYGLKALKQKLFVDGLCYLLQEIYGIENKNNDKQANDDDTDDNGSECVICMCDVRDTLILPCRHLCLCNSCADSLRYQANNCPICRAPFRALLQIRALQKSGNVIQPVSPPDGSCDNIPPGYEAVSLIEALNGPVMPRQPPAAVPDLVETPDNEPAIQAAQILNRHNDRTPVKSGKDSDLQAPEFGMSVLLSRDEDNKETPKSPLLAPSAPENDSPKNAKQKRDTVKHVNEKTNNEEVVDDDSEAERMSPLLQNSCVVSRNNHLALNMDDVVEPIDDTDTEHEEQVQSNLKDKKKTVRSGEDRERGDDSDYYTPEEPGPIHSGPLYENSASPNSMASMESTPQKLPGTPLSHASIRSSGDSYTSGSSTRRLLVSENINTPLERVVNI